MTTMVSRCAICKHYTKRLRCKAFPNGIPKKIYLNQEKHNRILPKQVSDYIFELSEDFKDMPVP